MDGPYVWILMPMFGFLRRSQISDGSDVIVVVWTALSAGGDVNCDGRVIDQRLYGYSCSAGCSWFGEVENNIH